MFSHAPAFGYCLFSPVASSYRAGQLRLDRAWQHLHDYGLGGLNDQVHQSAITV